MFLPHLFLRTHDIPLSGNSAAKKESGVGDCNRLFIKCWWQFSSLCKSVKVGVSDKKGTKHVCVQNVCITGTY